MGGGMGGGFGYVVAGFAAADLCFARCPATCFLASLALRCCCQTSPPPLALSSIPSPNSPPIPPLLLQGHGRRGGSVPQPSGAGR